MSLDKVEPEIVIQSKCEAEKYLRAKGNIICPLILFRKNGLIYEPLQLVAPVEYIGLPDVHERVKHAFQESVYQVMPEEVILVYEGFFNHNDMGQRFLSLVYNIFEGGRTWVAPIINGNQVGDWSEIHVKSCDFYGVYEKVYARWN